MTGTIVRKKPNGFGFIKPDNGDKDVFFHAQALVDVAFDDIQEGERVSFDVEQGPKGPAATNVRRVVGGNADAANDDRFQQAA